MTLILYQENIHKSFSRELYHAISAALESNINDINSATKSYTLPIPPFTAIVLERAKQLGDIPSVITELHSEFSSFRSNILNINADIKNSRSIKEKVKALKYRNLLFQEASSAFKNTEGISFKEGINYTANLINPILKPHDPSSYSAAIILQPVEWIRHWWLRRPILPLYRIDQKVRNIHNYDVLIEKLWAFKVDKTKLLEYKECSKIIKELFNKY